MSRVRGWRGMLRAVPWLLAAGPAFFLSVLLPAESPAGTGVTARVSVDGAGAQANAASGYPSISADGRYVAFESSASNLVAGDTNGTSDIFVHDRGTGQTTRVSVDNAGTQADAVSVSPSISADGRYVAFASYASNLVAGDTNGMSDIFVRDLWTGTTTRVSVDSDGAQADAASIYPSISADGRYVAFASYASNLVAGDTNGASDIFVHDRQAGQTTRVSVDNAGLQANAASEYPAISGDGRSVVFQSSASNLVAGDANGASDIFVHDREAGATIRVSVDSAGNEANGGSGFPFSRSAISGDGRYVVFASLASNLVPGDTGGFDDVFVHDRQTGATTRVSVDSAGNPGNSDSGYAYSLCAISADGRYVAFESAASNLVAGDTDGYIDVFLHDRQAGRTSRVSVTTAGGQVKYGGEYPAISGDGRSVAFQSYASDLVAGDTNGVYDVFVRRIPAVPGDFDSDGKADAAVWRSATSMWYVLRSSNGAAQATRWGDATDVVVPGDYDGDGKTDVAVWRPSTSTWYVLQSSNGAVQATRWGDATDVVVPGDYDGDGKTDVAVWRPSTSTWYVLQSSDGAAQATRWGDATDVAVPGDYDGDGKTDVAVWRPSTSTWYVLQSSDGVVQATRWGDSTDVPIEGSH